jgi:hypothetical protein
MDTDQKLNVETVSYKGERGSWLEAVRFTPGKNYPYVFMYFVRRDGKPDKKFARCVCGASFNPDIPKIDGHLQEVHSHKEKLSGAYFISAIDSYRALGLDV